MQYGEALEVLNTEGVWMLNWALSIAGCSPRSSGDLNIKGEGSTSSAGSSKEATCPNNDQAALAFSITETRDSGLFFDNRQPCAVLAETTPAPSPCAVTIGAAAAASVSSSLTHWACVLQTGEPTTPWCPEPEEDAAGRVVVPGSRLVVGGVACLVAAVGGLGLLGVV